MQDSIARSVLETLSASIGLDISKINISDRIEADLHVTGDDAYEFMEEFSQKYNIDMSSFEFNMYFANEGSCTIYEFVRGKKERNHRKKFPITVYHLIEVARKWHWFEPISVNTL